MKPAKAVGHAWDSILRGPLLPSPVGMRESSGKAVQRVKIALEEVGGIHGKKIKMVK